MKNFNNTLYIIILLFAFQTNSFSQMEISLEEKALMYFCENLDMIDSTLAKYKFEFNGKLNKNSKVYDVAYCLKDINLIKDSIPNKHYLDSLNSIYMNFPSSKNPSTNNINCSKFNNKKCKSEFKLFLYNAINYRNKKYVELFILNKKMGYYKIICFEFNNEKKIISHCKLHIIYD